MKILIVSACPTHPTTAGNRRFILDQVELLKKLGNDCFFLFIKYRTIHKNTENDGTEEKMQDYWKNQLFIYHQSIFQKFISLLTGKYRRLFNKGFTKCDDRYPFNLHKKINSLNRKYNFDACLLNYYYLTKAFDFIQIPRKGLVTHDYFAYKSLLVGDKYVLNNLTADEEAKAMQRSPYIFALNEGEAEYFRRLSPQSKVLCVYGCFNHRSSPITNNHNLLMLSGSNPYNLNGLKWFLNNVFKIIIKRYPEVELVIGGAICNVIKEWNLPNNVKLVGPVESPDEFYNMGDVVINPTYQGTGLKIKTFEAISYDKVLLTHPHSKVGIYKKDESPIFASEEIDEWVAFLSRIWSNEYEIRKIKENNKKYLCEMNKYITAQYNVFLNN